MQILRYLKSKYLSFFSARRVFRHSGIDVNLVVIPPATPEPHDISIKNGAGGRFRSTDASADSMAYENLQFPSPLQRQNGRLSSPEDRHLPAISKIAPLLIPPHKVAHTRLGLSIPSRPPPEPEFVALPSTPFSLTTPLFCHGPIHIERRQRYISPEDENLDWTAFQISIIGVMGNEESVQDEVEWGPGEVELDDLESWFAGFGFDIGSMVKEGRDGWIEAHM